MTEEQYKKCKEIVNSWNGEIDADFHNSFKSIVKLFMEDKNSNKSPYKITDEILSVISEVKDFNEVKIEILRLEILDIHFSMSFEGFLSDTRERINEIDELLVASKWEDVRKNITVDRQVEELLVASRWKQLEEWEHVAEKMGIPLEELSLEKIKKWLDKKKINNAIKIRMD